MIFTRKMVSYYKTSDEIARGMFFIYFNKLEDERESL